MKFLNKLLFRKEAKNLQNHILNLGGYFSLGKNQGELLSLSNESFFKIHNKIQSLYEEFQKLDFEKGEKNAYKGLFRFFQAKQFLLSSDLEKAQLFAEDIQKTLYGTNDIYFVNGKSWLLLNSELIQIQVKNSMWISKIDIELQKIELAIEEKNIIIESCKNEYNNLELNSPEHLEIAKKHLEAYVELCQLKIQLEEGNVLGEGQKIFGEELLKQLDCFLEKIKNNKSIEHDNLFKSLVVLEKIKLQFYLGVDKKNIFQNMTTFCRLQIAIKNNDPIGYVIGIFWPPCLSDKLLINNEKAFLNYLKSFYIEIYNTDKKEAIFNMKQYSNFIAKDINERLKIHSKNLSNAENTHSKI